MQKWWSQVIFAFLNCYVVIKSYYHFLKYPIKLDCLVTINSYEKFREPHKYNGSSFITVLLPFLL